MSQPSRVVCPNRKLENKRGDNRCAGCGNTLPRFAGLPKVATPTVPDEGGTPSAAPRPDTEATQAVDADDVKRVLAVSPPAHVPDTGEISANVNAVAWMHCDPLPPIALIPGREITIGRKGCKLTLPHTEVSRHHATIKVVAANDISIIDHGSSNGTYVNGKRVTTQPLRVGDQIKLGPYSLELWQVKDLPAEDPESTRAVPLTFEPTFSGKLGGMGLVEVLESIASRKRTGLLFVTDRTQRGRIRFEAGETKEAEWGPLRGQAAIDEMSRLSFGTFAFAADS
ncbi:MAG: FHA domain-containing protein [Planctomycetota bacterium]